MCGFCSSRRGFVLGVAALALPAPARIEPRVMLLPRPGFRVALTLDACPGAFDERIATGLVESRIKATIFLTGDWIRRNPAGLAFFRSHPDLFTFQNHGEHHIPPVLGAGSIYGLRPAGDLAAIGREVAGGAQSIQAATGNAPAWYRAATGLYSPEAIPAIVALGQQIGGYSLNADMGASLPAARVAERIAGAANGDIIVGHINQPHRASGPGILAGARALQARGAEFVHLDPVTAVVPARAP